MTASVTYPTGFFSTAELTDLMGGTVPTVVTGPTFDTATWSALPDEAVDVADMLLGLREVSPDLAVKIQLGSAP